MSSAVETDATTVRLRQHRKLHKKWIVLGLIILIVFISSILVYIRYVYEKDEDKSKQQQQYTLFEYSAKFIAIDDNGTVHDVPKLSPRTCARATWSKAAATVVGGNGKGSKLNQLAYPSDMFVDGQNAIYIADSINNRIVKWDEGASEGRVVAGGSGNGSQANQLNYPTAVFVDSQEDIYIADNGNNRIQKWLKNSTFGEMIIAQIGECWGLYVDKEYNVYYSEVLRNRVTKWSPEAQYGTIVLKSPRPMEIHVHEPTGDIFVASYTRNSIKQFASNGSLIRRFGREFVKGPFGFVINSNSPTETSIKNLKKYKDIQLKKPEKVQFDSHGNVLVLDSNDHRVQKFSIQKKGCVVSNSDYSLSSYHTATPHSKLHFHVDMKHKYDNQESFDATNRFKEKSSPTDEIFFPVPPFGQSLPSIDDYARQTGKYSSIDLPKIWPSSNNFRPPTDFDVDRPRSSSFSRGRSGRKG